MVTLMLAVGLLLRGIEVAGIAVFGGAVITGMPLWITSIVHPKLRALLAVLKPAGRRWPKAVLSAGGPESRLRSSIAALMLAVGWRLLVVAVLALRGVVIPSALLGRVALSGVAMGRVALGGVALGGVLVVLVVGVGHGDG